MIGSRDLPSLFFPSAFPVMILPGTKDKDDRESTTGSTHMGKEDKRCYLGALPSTSTVDAVHLDARLERSVSRAPSSISIARGTETPRSCSYLTHNPPRHILGSLGPWTRAVIGQFHCPCSISHLAKRKMDGLAVAATFSPSRLLLSSYSRSNLSTHKSTFDAIFALATCEASSCSYRFGRLRKIEARRPRA